MGVIIVAGSTDPSIQIYTNKAELICYCLLVVVFACKMRDHGNYSYLYLMTNGVLIGAGFCSLYAPIEAIRVLKALRVLNLMNLLGKIEALGDTAKNIVNSMQKVLNVLIPAFFIIYIYAIVGLYSFAGKFINYLGYEYNKCRDPANIYLEENWTVYSGPVSLCGALDCPMVDSIQLECLNPITYGVTPNPE